jgi:hypothetical protein
MNEQMPFTRLSDAELRRLSQEDGETAPGAREELEQRHFQAVLAFASVVSPSAGDELAGQAWELALPSLDEVIAGAMRPRALVAVLQVAADWLSTDRRGALAPELADWFEPDMVPDADIVRDLADDSVEEGSAVTGAARLAHFRTSSVAARAFERLPVRSQTVLWHHEVEQDDVVIGWLLGMVAEDVSLLNRRARREFYTAYVSLHQDEIVDDACRRLHRMLLAYADQTSMKTPGDLVSHLDQCTHCARAVDDLERMRFEFGGVLAEALLPWGGAEYALASRTAFSTTPDASEAAGAGWRKAAGARAWAGTTGLVRRVPGAVGAIGAVGSFVRTVPGAAALKNEERTSRARRLALPGALVGLCSLAALAFAGGLMQGENSATPRPGSTSGALAPGGPEPTATSPGSAKKPAPGDRPGRGNRSSPVRGAALEWLFDGVDDGVTVDTSGNGIEGVLYGDPLPEQGNGGTMKFYGQQAVVSDGPVVDTSKSFSVSARARMNDTAAFQTVISQDASDISGFAVQYDPDSDRWEMITPKEDDANSRFIQAGGSPGPPADTWTYLAGVYDTEAGEIRLYVDGKLQDTAQVARGAVPGGVNPTTSSSTSTTTTTTTTSGGGFGGAGGLGGFDDRGGAGGAGGAGGGFFGNASGNVGDFAPAPNLPQAGELANGIIRDVTGASSQLVAADGDFAVGRGMANDQLNRGFNGSIDDVRAFTRALTGKEAASLAGR